MWLVCSKILCIALLSQQELFALNTVKLGKHEGAFRMIVLSLSSLGARVEVDCYMNPVCFWTPIQPIDFYNYSSRFHNDHRFCLRSPLALISHE